MLLEALGLLASGMGGSLLIVALRCGLGRRR